MLISKYKATCGAWPGHHARHLPREPQCFACCREPTFHPPHVCTYREASVDPEPEPALQTALVWGLRLRRHRGPVGTRTLAVVYPGCPRCWDVCSEAGELLRLFSSLDSAKPPGWAKAAGFVHTIQGQLAEPWDGMSPVRLRGQRCVRGDGSFHLTSPQVNPGLTAVPSVPDSHLTFLICHHHPLWQSHWLVTRLVQLQCRPRPPCCLARVVTAPGMFGDHSPHGRGTEGPPQPEPGQVEARSPCAQLLPGAAMRS